MERDEPLDVPMKVTLWNLPQAVQQILDNTEAIMATQRQMQEQLDAIEGKVGALDTEVKDLISKLALGEPVTQEMIDQATRISAALSAIPGEPA